MIIIIKKIILIIYVKIISNELKTIIRNQILTWILLKNKLITLFIVYLHLLL